MYDPARDAWADRDADAGSWPQRRSVDQQTQSHSPPAPASAQAPRPVSPVYAAPVPDPGLVSNFFYPLVCLVLPGYSECASSSWCGYFPRLVSETRFCDSLFVFLSA